MLSDNMAESCVHNHNCAYDDRQNHYNIHKVIYQDIQGAESRGGWEHF